MPATLLFDHPSIEGITSLISQETQAASPEVRIQRGVDQKLMLATVIACVSEVLGTDVAVDAPLMAAGIDSLGATELQ